MFVLSFTAGARNSLYLVKKDSFTKLGQIYDAKGTVKVEQLSYQICKE